MSIKTNKSRLRSTKYIRHIPDTKRPFYPLWRRYLEIRGLLKRAVRSILPNTGPLTVHYLRRTGLHIKMLLESPEQWYVAHLSAAGLYGKHVALVHRAAMVGGVPTQHIVGATESFPSRLRAGLRVVILNYVPGQSNNDVYTLEQCSAVGRTLALLHNIRAPFWGSPALRLPAVESRTRLLAEWSALQHAISEVPGFPWLISESKINRWMEEQSGFLDNKAIFSLVHGDPHQNNVVFDLDGKAYLVDLDTAEYSIGAVELVIFMMEAQCGLNPERQNAFIKGYLEQASVDISRSWTEHAALATVVAMLILVSSYLSKAATRRALGLEKKAEACVEVARKLWLWRQCIVDASPTPGTNWWSLLDSAPAHMRLASDSASVKLALSKEPATLRHPEAYVHANEGWVL